MIGIAAFIFILVAPIFVYRSAKQNGHNAILWTIISVVVGFGIQIIVPLIIGLIVGIVLAAKGASQTDIQESSAMTALYVIGFVSVILSVVGVLTIMKKVNTVNESVFDKQLPPPPPPTFN